jgi:hypothetical protein
VKFLEGLLLAAISSKATIKRKILPDGTRLKIARLEFAVPFTEKPQANGSACGSEILAIAPKEIQKAFAVMGHPHGAICCELDTAITSQNFTARMAPHMGPKARDALKLEGVDLSDFRLEIANAGSNAIALYFSVAASFTADVAQFLAQNFGEYVFLSISECQQELVAQSGSKDDTPVTLSGPGLGSVTTTTEGLKRAAARIREPKAAPKSRSAKAGK